MIRCSKTLPGLAGAVLLFSVTSLAGRQLTSDSPLPPKRAHHALAFDATRGEVVLYGGSGAAEDGTSRFFDDLWSFNGRRWQLVAATQVPRSSHKLIYDPDRRRLLSLGGMSGQGTHNETRVFEGGSWTVVNRHPALAVREPAVTYDTRRSRVVLFGGLKADKTASGDTWEFDGDSWKLVSTTGPAPLSSTFMVYDDARGVALLFSGGDEKRALSTETWQWDGSVWSRVATGGPPARFAAGFAFDSSRKQAVLFGGGGSGGRLADTWLWDGQAWQDARVAGPTGRYMPEMAYDQRRSVIVLFGGRISYPEDSNETWEWNGRRWTQVK